jgi:hypothetical protein
MERPLLGECGEALLRPNPELSYQQGDSVLLAAKQVFLTAFSNW